MFAGCEEILSGDTVRSHGSLKLVSGPRAEGYGLEVWEDGRLIELFVGDEDAVKGRTAAWWGEGGCDPHEMTPYDILIRTMSQKQWWSEHCDPAPGRDGR